MKLIISRCLWWIAVLGVLRSCELISCFLSLHFLKVWVKTHLFIPFRVSFYLDNFTGTCAFCMWAFIVFLTDPQGISFMMLWCSCFFFFLFTFISHLLFRSRICLAIKCSSQNHCGMMQFYFLKFGKRSCTRLNKPSFIKNQGS